MFSKNRNRSYTNGEITIVWRAAECTHSTICYTRLRSVFDPVKRPWINATGAPTADILKIIEDCPTPALTFFWNDDQRNKTEHSAKLFKGDLGQLLGGRKPVPAAQESPQTTINIRPNGPVVISGNLRIIDATGKEMPNIEMISICRCGASGNMPHCDGTHFKIGFKSS